MRIRLLTVAALIAAGLGAPSAAQSGSATKVTDFTGMWEARPPRGPGGPGGPNGGPPDGGPGRGEPSAGQGFSPPLNEDDGKELGGPDIVGLDRGDRMTYRIMTPAGQAAFAAMDPRKLPANNCQSNGLPTLALVPDLQQWAIEGNSLRIHYGDFGTRRSVYLGEGDIAARPSHLGFSTGAVVDGELIITTTQLTASLGGLGRNAPGSASRTFVERYRLTPDRQRLTGTITVHDPEYLTRDLVLPINLVRVTDVSEIPDVECSVENSQLYLNAPSGGR
jgi:hypothetical protein